MRLIQSFVAFMMLLSNVTCLLSLIQFECDDNTYTYNATNVTDNSNLCIYSSFDCSINRHLCSHIHNVSLRLNPLLLDSIYFLMICVMYARIETCLFIDKIDLFRHFYLRYIPSKLSHYYYKQVFSILVDFMKNCDVNQIRQDNVVGIIINYIGESVDVSNKIAIHVAKKPIDLFGFVKLHTHCSAVFVTIYTLVTFVIVYQIAIILTFAFVICYI